MKTKRSVQAELVEFTCEECNQGVYRVDSSAAPKDNQWKHICSNCGKDAFFAYPFPFIEYKGQEFVLRKHTVRQRVEPNN